LANVLLSGDALDGMVAVQGWQEQTDETVHDFGKRMLELGARRFLFHDIGRDGMLQGAMWKRRGI
jgi:phosphoribosylformimino-5-aminoimidazole carboxamide ribotide isomerase